MSELSSAHYPVQTDDLFGDSLPPETLYARQMDFLKKGYALWSPSPSLIDGVRDPPVRVGDLGYIDSGRWRWLFNVHLQPGMQGQAKLLPKQFEVLPEVGVGSEDLPSSQQWSPKSSSSLDLNFSIDAGSVSTLKGIQGSFNVNKDASLAYIGPARREEVTEAYLSRYAQYTHRNCRHWEEFLSDNGMTLGAEHLVLVTSCILAASWVTSVSYTRSSSVSVGVSISFDANANISVSLGHQSSDSPGPMTNSGPVYRTIPPADGKPVLDQCLFVKGFSPSIWDGVLAKISEPPGRDRRNVVNKSGRETVTLPKPSTFKAAALQYIHQNSDAAIALVHDDDLFPFAQDTCDGKDPQEILSVKKPKIFINNSAEGQIGSLKALQ